MATLKEIADLASVSVATASRALNGSAVGHPVSEAVQARVRSAAAQLGYTPSAPARALRARRTSIVGVITSDILDPYFGELARSIEIEAGRLGFVLIVANTDRDPGQERLKFELLREHRAAGIVFCGSDIDGAPGTARLAREVDAAVAQGTRVVALAPRHFAADRIVVDNVAAGGRLTEHLLDLGHRDIAFIGDLPGLASIGLRIDGYTAAITAAGGAPRVLGRGGLTQESGRSAMGELLAGSRAPDAVVCANDEVAVGVVAGLWNAGLHAPETLSVAGIGGTRVGEQFGLTTMSLELGELGMVATRYITSVEGAPPSAPGVRLVVRSSTRAWAPRR